MIKKSIQIVGPFITNYSLARVNRGLASGFYALFNNKKDYSIVLFREKDKIDRWPTEQDLNTHQIVKEIWSEEPIISDIVIYNDFPQDGITLHKLEALPGHIKLMYLAWEESVFPKIWIGEMNKSLNGVLVASSFVRDVLRTNGLTLPIKIAYNAIDEAVLVKPNQNYHLKSKKSFKFLHVSSGRKRKGIDVLIQSYFQAFSKNNDVCLVIKSFPGPDNQVNELLARYKTEHSPEVEHIFDSELTDRDLVHLMHSCNAVVYPSRAEGFGLPIAEAMEHGLPVIATNYSAYLDFVNQNNAFLVDYELQNAIDSEMVNLGAKWAEPNMEDLIKQMKNLYDKYDVKHKKYKDEVNTKIQFARESVKHLRWKNTAQTALNFIEEIEKAKHLKSKNFAVITPFNSQGGIAEHSKKLYTKIESSFNSFYYISNKDIADRINEDKENVFRTWQTGENNFLETLEFIKKYKINYVDIQYHSGTFFPIQSLDRLIQLLKSEGVYVQVILHAVKGSNFDFIKESKNLQQADRVVIHNKKDFDYASKILKNVVLFPLPIEIAKKRDSQKLRTDLCISENAVIIASHGLMNSNKNIPTIIEAFNELKQQFKDIVFLSVNAVVSNNIASQGEFERAKKLVKLYNLEDSVRFITPFLSKNLVDLLLQVPDIVILAYSDVGESASAAVRTCIAARKPVIVTDIPMMAEFNNEVFKIKQASKSEISNGLKKLITQKSLRDELVKVGKTYIESNSFEKKSLEWLQLLM